MSEQLQKQAQEKLAAAAKLVDEATEFAEQGGFTLTFGRWYGTYWPRSMNTPEVLRKLALEYAENYHDGWTGMSEEEREQLLEDIVDSPEDYDIDDGRPGEYARPGQWWQPSRNC